MMTDDTKELLHDYCRDRSEAAFRALVRQHSPVVYGTALRKLGGNRAAAQDVTQEVFTLLARKADRLGGVVLGGWLYRQASRRAANHVRAESRRKRRESIVMENLAISSAPDEPVNESLTEKLDDALLSLPEKDRDALILRFFEGREFKSLGTALGLSEEAARKRVARALDRLTTSLRRKGIAVGSVSLGTAMQGFGTTPVPAAMISQVSSGAFQAGAGGWAVALTWLAPIAAGVLVTSAVTGGTPALRPKNPQLARTVGILPANTARNPRTARFMEKLPEHPTLEQIIAEIQRIRSSPGNALTELRQKAVLAKVQIEQIPEFIALGNKQFDEEGRRDVFSQPLGSWWRKNHEEALDFMLEMLKTPRPSQGAFLVRSYFGKWEMEDTSASHRWLFKHWDDPILSYPAFSDTLRGDLAKEVVSRMFGNGEIDAIFQFVSHIPRVSDQAEALEPVAGHSGTHGIWDYSDDRKDQWRQVYRGLESIPDAACRLSLTRDFWKKVSENSPAQIAEVQSFIEPADSFVVSLGWLSVRNFPSEKTENMAGGTSIRYQQVTDLEARVRAATEAGLNAGLSPQTVKDAVAETLRKRGGEDAGAWLKKNAKVAELDSSPPDRVKKGAFADGYIGGPETTATVHATGGNDPDLMPRMSRGAFRRLLYHSPDEALDYLNNAALAPGLKQELQTIATGAP